MKRIPNLDRVKDFYRSNIRWEIHDRANEKDFEFSAWCWTESHQSVGPFGVDDPDASYLAACLRLMGLYEGKY